MLKPCDRGGDYRPHNVTDRNGQDQSRTKKYVFNSLGYRSEEFKPDALFKIFVFGCSNTFVTGLNVEEGFPYKFKQHIAHYFGYEDEQVNLMNFSAGGHSTDYSVRTMLRQCERVTPDLILFDPSPNNRIEYVREGGYGDFFCPSRPDLSEEMLKYYDWYTPTMGFVNFAKNVLLIQHYCQSRSIDYLIHIRWSDIDRYRSNASCLDYIEVIDMTRLCSTRDIAKIDHAADLLVDENGDVISSHDGPETNSLIAERLFEFACTNVFKKQPKKLVNG